MSNLKSRYKFIVSEDGESCAIFMYRPYKYVGTVIKAQGKRSRQKFATGVNWLPINDALEEMGAITKEESILGKLGY